MISAFLWYIPFGAVVLAGAALWRRGAFGGGKDEIERRKPGRQAGEALEERRKDDDVGGEA
jgi:hypothetical protein